MHKIIFLIGLIMFFIGSYLSDKLAFMAIIAVLGGMMMGTSFMFKKDKQ